MKNILALLLLGLSSAHAGNVASRQLQTNTVSGVSAPVNHVKNDGLENGTRFWAASGGTLTTTSTAGSGVLAGSWDSNAASQTMCSDLKTIQGSDQNVTQEAGFMLQCASGTCTHKIQVLDGSSNVLFSQDMVSSTTYVPNYYSAGSGGTGTKKLCLTSVSSNEPIVYFDDAYLGRARNIGSVAQATLVAAGYIDGTTSCKLTRTSTTLGAFTDVSACPGVTVEQNTGPGTLQTTDANNAKFTVASLPPGNYIAIVDQYIGENSNGTGTMTVALNDGTTTTGHSSVRVDGSGGGNNPRVTITGAFNYSSTGDRTFTVFGAASGSNTIFIENQNTTINRINFRLLRFPSSSEIAVRPELQNLIASAYHSNNCAWDRSSSSYGDPAGDSTCTFTQVVNSNGTITSALSGSDPLPGVIVTPNTAGTYKVCVNGPSFATGSGVAGVQLFNSTASVQMGEVSSSLTSRMPFYMCGLVQASSISPVTVKLQIRNTAAANTQVDVNTSASDRTLYWTVEKITQNTPSPVLVGSVTSQSTGAERSEWATAGGSGSFTTSCSSSPCSIIDQSGSWLSSITRNGTGDYTFNIASGVFSGTPACILSADTAEQYNTGTWSATAVNFGTSSSNGTAQNAARMTIICRGHKGSL